MKTKFTDIAKKVVNGLKKESVITGLGIGGMALVGGEIMAPGIIAAGVSAALGLAVGEIVNISDKRDAEQELYRKDATEHMEKYYAEHPGAREKDEAEAKAKQEEQKKKEEEHKKRGFTLAESLFIPGCQKNTPFGF